jgi:hypothetical protein
LAQLHVDDIGEHDGVTVLSINDEGDKRTKTPASTRKVPIHPRLVEAGLLEYHKLIRSEGWQRLFPELTKSNVAKNGYGKEPGRFFTKYRRRQGVSNKKRLLEKISFGVNFIVPTHATSTSTN